MGTHYQRKEIEIKKDNKDILKLRQNDHTWREIEEIMNERRDYSLSFLAYRGQYIQEMDFTIDEATKKRERMKMVEAIDNEIDELIDSWRRSKGVIISKMKKMSGQGETGKKEMVINETEGFGDVGYMNAIDRKRERRSKLLGLDIPTININKNIETVDKDFIEDLEKELKIERKNNR